MNRYLCTMLAATVALCGYSQAYDQATFTSTAVNPDGTVTFYYHNPDAKSVQVDVQFAGRNDMQFDSTTGIWHATLGPAAPDMYPYCFVVDGVSIMDPANQQYFPNEGFKNSLLAIPGNQAYSINNVPHGNVDYIRYYSDAIGTYNNALVYTPPSYDTDHERLYPVFYLISGTTDTEEVYYKVGRVNYILDNLIAEGKANDMIVVMPYGNPAKLIGETMAVTPGGMRDYFSQDLIGDLMPYVEQHYRTINDADHRAIGGFSRGGNQALMNGLKNLDKFSYLCSYSSFTSTDIPVVYDDAATNSKIHLLWSGVGTDDFLYGNARDYTEFLDNKGIRCVKYYTDDKMGHTWMNAKCFLLETLPLLFNAEASAQAMANATPTKAKTGQEMQFTPGVMARLFPKPIISPEINGDEATFRIKADQASQVYLVGDFASDKITMTCDTTGIWSATISGLKPEVYCYNFIVDGTEVADAQNMYLATDRGKKRSVLDLTPQTNARQLFTPVQYRCDNLPDGTQRHYAVIKPADTSVTAMPVIALVANGNDTFESWYKIAKANIILDEMIASGNADPAMLYLTDTAIDGAVATLYSADYPTWQAARQALTNTLANLKSSTK